MNRQNKIVVTVSIIIALALVLGIVGSQMGFFATTASGVTCSGGQVLSISSATITDSAELSKKVVRVTFSTLPSSECLTIKLDPNVIDQKLKESGITNFDATKSLIGDIVLTKEQKVYNINERSDLKFYKIGITPVSLGVFEFCTVNTCQNKLGSNFPVFTTVKESLIGGCNCLYDDYFGNKAEFASSSEFKWETQVSIAGQSIILSDSKLSGKIGTIAFVKWALNGLSNNQLDSVNQDAYKPLVTNQFRMTDKGVQTNLYNQYQTLRQLAISHYSSGLSFNPASDLTNIRAYNTLFDTLTRNRITDWVNSESLVQSASILSNKLYVNLKSPVVYPQFTMDIDAQSVGIFLSYGKPKVTCPTVSGNLISGQTRDVSIQLSNIGSNSGSFSYDLTCNKGSQIVQPSPPIRINAGSSTTLSTRLGLTVSEGTDTSTCKFTAQEINTLETATCSFSYSAIKQTGCIVNTKSCEAGNTELWICRSDGGYDKQKCDFGCESFEDSYRCKQESTPNPIESKFNLTTLFKIFRWILLVLASLVALVFGRNLSDKYLIRENKLRWISWVLGLILGIAVGLVAYLLLLTWIFWVIVAGLIVIYVVLPLVFPELKLLSKLRQ